MNSETKVEQRKVGSQGLIASAQGLGTMGMTAFYEGADVSEEEKIDAIGRALELGINFLDTAWIYVNLKTGETNEGLVGKALKKFGRENFVVATKGGNAFTQNGLVTTGDPKIIKQQCEESLKRLGIDCIDLYYLHRIDPNTPLELTMQGLAELRDEGKIKYVGLSECTPEELERAHKVFPITAIQMEWSLQTRDIEKTVVPVARKLGVAIVAYSPLGRGMLSRTFTKKEDLGKTDWRATLPRFTEENFDENLKTAERFEEYAKSKGYTAAQLALAWLQNQGDDVFPIPGTKTSKRIEENSRGALIKLTPEELAEIEALVPEAKGTRYNEETMKRTYQGRI
jgi:aryl-alcohol dehydrogenase-like predicted oxidoreductase